MTSSQHLIKEFLDHDCSTSDTILWAFLVSLLGCMVRRIGLSVIASNLKDPPVFGNTLYSIQGCLLCASASGYPRLIRSIVLQPENGIQSHVAAIESQPIGLHLPCFRQSLCESTDLITSFDSRSPLTDQPTSSWILCHR